MMEFLSEYLDLILIASQVMAVVFISIIIGFSLARWMYRIESTSRNQILQQEIMRLRRKLSEREVSQSVVERHHQRLKRQVRMGGADQANI